MIKLKKKKKEVATKQGDLNSIIGHMEKWQEQLYDNKKVSATAFRHMQAAILGCKNIVRDNFGAERFGEMAWQK